MTAPLSRQLLALLALLLAATPAAAADDPLYYRYLSRETVGAAAFTKAHPTWDGRGVVVAVLDTGVDPSVAGLLKTSAGETKVIETRDFSGEGDVRLRRAHLSTEGGVDVLRTSAGFVHPLPGNPPPGGAAFWLGFFSEDKLARSDVRDVNRNGSTDDTFAVLVLGPGADGLPRVWIDTDGDGEVADEVARKSYAHEPTWFTFTHPDPKKDQTPVAFTVTVMPEGEPVVELHFDDGGHGTHVAGIATGFGIQGRAGFDGIAPGARVMSLKIGNNTLSGGATTPGSMARAVEYAGRWSDEHLTPVIINLSYGIGSEAEGNSDIDRALTKALQAHPLLAATVSAGNEGPGLSTVGTPGASPRAFTVGALLVPDNAEALYGSKLSGPRVFGFSSRGGELAKPDALTPGVAWSTVPPFLARPVMAGTSMAAPQAAGVHALLVSAALQSKVPWTSGLLKRVLRATAKALRDYSVLDQGAGVVSVPRAFEALQRAASGAGRSPILDWDVEVSVPHRPGELGTAVFWRTGGWVPAYPHTVSVELRPVFRPQATDAERGRWFDTLKLSADAGWVDLDRTRIAFRGEASAKVHLSLDGKALSRPGLHTATITATPSGDSIPAFTIPVSVVTPHTFRESRDRTRHFTGRLGPSDIARHFVEVPAGATDLSLMLAVPEGRYGQVYLELFDPEGQPVDLEEVIASSRDGDEARVSLGPDRLRPGVWEVVVYASLRNLRESHFALDVGFEGLQAQTVLDYGAPETGGLGATWEVTQRFDEALHAAAEARLWGIVRTRDVDLIGTEHTEELSLAQGLSGARIRLKMSVEDYGRFTDVAVNIVDASGKPLVQSGFVGRFLELDLAAGAGTYKLEIVAATVGRERESGDKLEWSMEIEELQRLTTPVPLVVSSPTPGRGVTFYPGVTTPVTLSTETPLRELPTGFGHAAEVVLTPALRRDSPLRRELRLDPIR